MKKASYAIFGLGRFGHSIAEILLDANCEVMVIDKSEELVQELSKKAAYAICADVTESGVLDSLGIKNLDVVIIGIGGNLEANIMTAMYAKEVGVDKVIAKCSSPLHGAILNKIGVDEVIYPEREMGKRVARNLLSGGFVDLFELSENFSMAEVLVKEAWIGKSLSQLNMRDSYKVNVVALIEQGEVYVNIDPNKPLKEGQMLIVLGDNRDLNHLAQ